MEKSNSDEKPAAASDPCRTGSVCLAGTGPGDPELLTLRVLEVLRCADVVVYDHLVSASILDYIPSGVRRIYAGKKSGAHSMTQKQINDLLISEAKKGNRVVRLKGGDPFVFGRGGEELAELTEAGIPCEIIPGITSAIAVPAYAGIPVTFRGVSASFHIFTGHGAADSSPDYDYEAIVRTGGTIVFLMGIATASAICRSLIAAGMDEHMPAAAIANGTTAEQQTVVSSVSELPVAMQRAGIQSPAVLVFGRTVGLREQLDWFRFRPLAGKRIIVTRPEPRCGDLCRELSFLGAEALACPVIAVRDTKSEKLSSVSKLLAVCRWIAFSSSSGVDSFFRLLSSSELDARSLAGKKIAAIGPVTASRLESHGIRPDLIPTVYDSISLARTIVNSIRDSGDRVLSVRSSGGDSDAELIFKQSGIAFDRLDAYGTVPVRGMSPETAAVVSSGEFDYLVFASASAADGFAEAFPNLDVSECRAVCIGEKTAAAVKRIGIRKILTAKRATGAGIVETLTASVSDSSAIL